MTVALPYWETGLHLPSISGMMFHIYINFNVVALFNLTAYFDDVSSHLAQCQVSRVPWVRELA